jgi:hypothetical protein
MKFRIQFKDPDAVSDQVTDAVDDTRPPNLSDKEWQAVKDVRIDEALIGLGKWIKYCEYVTIEFDMESGNATVIPTS